MLVRLRPCYGKDCAELLTSCDLRIRTKILTESASASNPKARDLKRRTGDGRKRAEARGVKMGQRPKLTDHQKRDAIKRRDHGDETLAEIGRSYNVSGWTISRLER